MEPGTSALRNAVRTLDANDEPSMQMRYAVVPLAAVRMARSVIERQLATPISTPQAALLLSACSQLRLVGEVAGQFESQIHVHVNRRVVGHIDVLVHSARDTARQAQLDRALGRIAAPRSLRLAVGTDDEIAKPRVLLDVGGRDLLRLPTVDEPPPAREHPRLVHEQAALLFAIEEAVAAHDQCSA